MDGQGGAALNLSQIFTVFFPGSFTAEEYHRAVEPEKAARKNFNENFIFSFEKCKVCPVQYLTRESPGDRCI